ncbi:hypothetical protein R84B8_01587 [Treponema sp. R8-4-B8]
MDSKRKIINLCLITLLFIAPLWAEPIPGDEETVSNEALSPDEETPHDKDSPLSDEFVYDDDLDDSYIFEAPTLVFQVPSFETRSFDEIFPNFSRSQKRFVMSTGLRFAFEKNESPTLVPDPNSGVNLFNKVMSKKPSHIIEALVVVPYNKRELDMLDVYNALGRIKNIQNQVIVVREKEYKLFTDTTRLESAQVRKPIPDPPPADTLPYSETMYLRLVDYSMGDFYLRGEITVSLYGITYNLTNFRDVSYSIFRIMKAEKFIAIVYLEPIKEGILIYSMSGLYIPNFVANRINLTSSMNYRITVLINWITEGLRRVEEDESQNHHFFQMRKE